MNRHEEYRPFLIDHLLSVTLRHWDPAMRQLGAQSLRTVCNLNLPLLGPEVAARAVRLNPNEASIIAYFADPRQGSSKYRTQAMSMAHSSL